MKSHKPKLPVQQLAILAVARFAEPLAFTSVFPYLPEMIASFGVEKKDIAKWAGATSSVFSLAQSITAVPWGRASDRFGRKPTILVGLFCTMVCFLIWGVSTSLPMAIAIRAIQGASNGNVGIIRTMVAEMVPERELQPRAFSIMPLVWSIGSIFGPAFGGFFAKPAERFPALFGGSAFLRAYPFALPNIMGSIIFMASLTTALLFLHESLYTKRHARDWGRVLGARLSDALMMRGGNRNRYHGRQRRYSFQDDEATAPLLATHHHHHMHDSSSKAQSSVSTMAVSSSAASSSSSSSASSTASTPVTTVDSSRLEKAPAAPSMRAVFTRQSVINLISYTFLALHSVAYDQVLPVFLNYPEHPQDDGGAAHPPPSSHLPAFLFFSRGFGLDSGSIGTIFTLYGVVCGLIQFLVFPMLCARFGVLRCFRGCALAFPLVYILTPYTALVPGERARYAALVAVMCVKAFAVIVGFPCTTILLTNSAASLTVLGTLNGFATTFSALGRALGPAVAGAAFSFGVRRSFIALPWWLLAAIAALGAVP
ncbi:putative major facilitator superfamily transporter protein [Eutypa lata UCREL1]|uniref:Putative major facilitator superfamily transporter protein n=1 Tax=Eutypa lata (strain UCR-EL1) TaxID=1287681 RepID=M7SEV1_EUTLA|nr:putative major facilitator superfamily transporter protein [Eutypa lata UCREL1]